MAYNPTTWIDRVVQNPNTFTTQENPDGSITLIPKPGTVTKQGTPVNASNLNKMEQGISDAHSQLADMAQQVDAIDRGIGGTYSNLAAIQAAFPTGNANRYVAADNGHWYYWNGSTWTDGGLFQGIGIADKSISENNLRYQSFGFGQLSDLTEQLTLPVSIKDFVASGCTVQFINGLELKGTTISGTSVTWQSIILPYKKLSFTLIKSEYLVIGKNATERIAICLLNNNYGKLFKFTDTTFSNVSISDFPVLPIIYFNSHKIEVSINGNIVDLYYYNDSNIKTLLYSFNINNYFSANYTAAVGFISHAATNTSGNLVRFYNESKSISKNDVYVKSEIDSMFSLQWSGKKGNALGDSITEQGTYLSPLSTMLGLASYTNYGQSGTTIAKQTEASTSAFCVRYSSMSDDADLVTVFGGTNDYGNSLELGTKASTELTTFYGALKALCAGLVTKYPTKRIFFFTPLQRDWQGGGQVAGVGANAKGYTLLDYCNAIKSVCADHGIPVVDLYSTSGITIGNITNWTSDRLHINAAGGERVGKQAGLFIKQYSV